jgi:pre-mRNA-processing factor 19
VAGETFPNIRVQPTATSRQGKRPLSLSPSASVNMLCSISGQVPVEPVVSVKSGHVFEKRLVLAYLTQNQSRCPVTHEELDADKDLLPLQPSPAAASGASASGASVSAFSPEAASIPQILALFQNEWDAVMLETFTLKKHLEKTRQELSHALYQHDAACRVIARLNGENESLRARLTARAAAPTPNGDDVDMDGADGLSAEAIATIEARQKALAKQRKEFKKKDGPQRAALLEGLGEWKAASSHTLHDSDKPGVLALAIDPKQPQRVATGGVDKQVQVFSTATQQLTATLTGHAKKVSDVAFHPSADLLVSGSYDKTVRIWSANDKGYAAVHSLMVHDDGVTSASIHATGDYVLSASLDASWALSDIRSGRLLARYSLSGDVATKGTKDANEALCAVFHPDGAIFGTGSKSKQVQMWDLKTMASVVAFEGHAAAVNTLAFSENGYQLATGSQDGVVILWDLRKLKSVFEINLNDGAGKKKMGPIHQVSFDPSGSYLAAAGTSIQVLKEVGKASWEVVKTFEDHKAAVTSVQFAPDSSYLASTSMDRSLKFYR